jgi:hypothetical protein
MAGAKRRDAYLTTQLQPTKHVDAQQQSYPFISGALQYYMQCQYAEYTCALLQRRPVLRSQKSAALVHSWA